MLPTKLAFVDLETSGASTNHDRIIEVGIVRVEDNKITGTYNSLVNPLSYIPPEIERITGISEKDVIHAPTFREVAEEVRSLLDGCTFVAHNVRFDYGFLRSEFARHDITFSSKHFCTVRLSRILYPEQARHNLDTIISRFGFTCENRHRAYDDARVIYEFYNRLQRLFPKDIFEKAVNLALKKPSLPPSLQKEVLETLPEQPGVYIMYGADDAPLYVGKSVNIKDRVLSHFTADIHSPTEMKISQQVTRLETVPTVGELGALLTESSMIKKLLPLYNKKLRIKRELTVIKKTKNNDGYEAITIEPVQKILPDDITESGGNPTIIGFFKSKKQAKEFLSTVAKEYQLCEKLLKIDTTNNECFAYRLGNCLGACINKELALKYNMRFIEAFSKMKVKPWPFQGPIAIEERNEITKQVQCFFIDKWCFLGTVIYDTDGNTQKTIEQTLEFDLDLYKILVGFLKSPDKLRSVRQLSTEHQEAFFQTATSYS